MNNEQLELVNRYGITIDHGTHIGRGNISAKVIADSVNPAGVRLTTFEIEVHRLVWSEFMTHRMFSRNAASSRAIPVQKTIDMVREKPAVPIEFGINQPGMQAKGFLQGEELTSAETIWRRAANDACNNAQALLFKNVHKQVVNRLLEPFVMMKAVVSATEWENFYNLRLHADADPHIFELARVMKLAHLASTPVVKKAGEWHLPYAEPELDLQDAIRVSASCCAQVSYRKLDTSVDKAKNIYERLIDSSPAHASPVEHQAMVPHEERGWRAPSRNFIGWVQQRALLNI